MDDATVYAEVSRHLQQAIRLGGEGKVDEAVVELERAAEVARAAGALGAAILPDILESLRATQARGLDLRLTAMNNEAAALLQAGNQEGARQAFSHLVEEYRRGSPVDAVGLARALTNLSVACAELGLDDEAQEHSREAKEILESAARQTDPVMTAVMHNWGYSHKKAGRWSAALHCFSAALRSLESNPHAEPLDTAVMAHEMADLLGQMLRPEDGFPLAYRCMETRSKALGTAEPLVGQAAHLAGRLLSDAGNHAKAVTYLRPAYQIFTVSLGPESGLAIQAMHDLFTAAWKSGDVETVEADLRNLIPLARSLGPNPLLCRELTDLAGLLAARGADAESRRLALEAEQAFGLLAREHDVGMAPYLEDLAALLTHLGEARRALPLLERAYRTGEVLEEQAVATRDAVFRRRYMARLARDTSALVRHVVVHAPGDRHGAAVAFEFVANRKGLRAESAMAHSDVELARRQSELAPILEKVRTLETRLQEVHAGGALDGTRKQLLQLDALRAEIRELNGEVEARTLRSNRPVRRTARRAQAAAVSAALPEGSALVEYSAILAPPGAADDEARLALEKSGDDEWLLPAPPAERYVAFVVRPGGAGVQIIDLGEAGGLERLIYSYLAAMSGGRRELVPREWQGDVLDWTEEALSRALRERLFDPLAGALGGCATVFVAPDGAICRVPFAALLEPQPSGDRLLDRLAIGYVASARDILGFGDSAPPPRESPLVVGDPDYDFAEPGTSHPAPEPVDGFPDFHFERLMGTADEAWRVSRMIGGRRVTGQQAHETALHECRSPAILHVATHGYYVRPFSQGLRVVGEWRAGGFGSFFRGEVLGFAGDPFLRSGIALAGVNAWSANRPLPPEVGDGLLTSAEVAHLNLDGTELVVLSACSGALGDVRPGDGVAGLLHGFRVAGARATIASLWQIPDEATEQVMQVFYEGLLAGRSRLEALRQAQRSLSGKAPPWQWGSYVCYGDPAPIRYRPATRTS